jgi:hypothetical protein
MFLPELIWHCECGEVNIRSHKRCRICMAKQPPYLPINQPFFLLQLLHKLPFHKVQAALAEPMIPGLRKLARAKRLFEAQLAAGNLPESELSLQEETDARSELSAN